MRRPYRLVAAAGLSLLAASASAQNLSAVKIADGFSSPVDLACPPGDARLFVVEQNQCDIHIIHPDGSITKFLDLTGKVSTGGERGLLGLAFHPDYANNGRFFVNYTRNNGNSRVEEYRVDPSDPNLADPNQVQTITIIPQPFSNHNGGGIKFGLDGMLYVGTGDGGSGNDPGNRAQDGQEKLGKMLRFDIDIASPFIPADNPFIGDPNVLDEIWALGLRNPWRFSFDRLTGDLWIGDVGQNSREEISWAPGASTGGENYGWRCMEGFNCHLSGCTCNDAGLSLPVHDYGHGGGHCSVTGGFAYRGPISGIQGTYFFADYCSSSIWSLEWDGTTVSNLTNRTSELEPPGSDTINSPTAFGEDSQGNLYIVDHSGEVYMIQGDCAAPTTYCVLSPNSAGPGATMNHGGTPSINQNDLELYSSGVPANQFGIFFYGPNQTQVAVGDGILCVGGSLKRLPVVKSDVAGDVGFNLDLNNLPGGDQLFAGDTRNFAFWFRDPPGGPAGYNFSNGLSVTFCP